MSFIDTETDAQEVINISSDIVRMNIDGMRVTLKPGDRMRVHKNYALPRKFHPERDALPSVVELESGKRVVLVSDKRAQSYLRSQGA